MMTSRDNFETWWQREFHNGNEPRGGWGVYRHSEGYSDEELSGQWKAWQAALASQQPAGDGWIEWGGDISVNEQPVSGMVEITYRNGVISKANAAVRFWGHEGIESDIIAYRVVKP